MAATANARLNELEEHTEKQILEVEALANERIARADEREVRAAARMLEVEARAA